MGGDALARRQGGLGGAAADPREAAAVAAARCAEQLAAMEAEDAELRARALHGGVGVSGGGSVLWAILSSWQALAVALVIAIAAVRWLLLRRGSWQGWAPRLTDSWDVAALCLLVVCGLYLMGFSYVPVLQGLGLGDGMHGGVTSEGGRSRARAQEVVGKLSADLEAMRWRDALFPEGVPPLPPGSIGAMVQWGCDECDGDGAAGGEEEGLRQRRGIRA